MGVTIFMEIFICQAGKLGLQRPVGPWNLNGGGAQIVLPDCQMTVESVTCKWISLIDPNQCFVQTESGHQSETRYHAPTFLLVAGGFPFCFELPVSMLHQLLLLAKLKWPDNDL